MDPHTPIENLPGIGKYYANKLKKLEINTAQDLIYHFPFRYDDFTNIVQIQNLTPGEPISIVGIVWQIKNIRTRSGKFLTRATVSDQSATIEVIWFNQPYLTRAIKPGMQISISGKVKIEGKQPQIISPQYEIIRNQQLAINDGQPTIHTARLVPIYPETEGVSSKWVRAKIAKVLPLYLGGQKDFLPVPIIENQKLISLEKALTGIHFPENFQVAAKARTRLAFDELFLLQLLSTLRKKDWQEDKTAPKFKPNKIALEKLIESLPFKLTKAQINATRQILADTQRSTPTNRLLEGDVGSGKTVVAAIAAYSAFLNGFDSLLAAPTEILAFQHQKTLDLTLRPFGITVGIWTASKKITGQITCGTHALLTSYKPERQVGLVIVDEQHRFGVAQRAKLFLNQSEKLTPHLLTMTATPIPRTLALTLYGDLDLSVLDEMPTGRQKIATFVVPNFKRNDAYKFIEKQVGEGRQVFIITPFVEPSETMTSVKSATDEFEKLKKIFSSSNILNTESASGGLSVNSVENLKQKNKSFSLQRRDQNDWRRNIRLGLLHGRLKSSEKEKIINSFKANKINILVSTPVVEVGIDVPNATVMMIESAERFGLAQLHQLRGRVGRGEHKSYCLLFTQSNSESSIKRLKSLEKVYVGFELAEIDLKMRGQGEIFGLKQSGFGDLKIADLSDQKLVASAQIEAKAIIEKDPKFTNFPLLAEKVKSLESELSQPN